MSATVEVIREGSDVGQIIGYSIAALGAVIAAAIGGWNRKDLVKTRRETADTLKQDVNPKLDEINEAVNNKAEKSSSLVENVQEIHDHVLPPTATKILQLENELAAVRKAHDV